MKTISGLAHSSVAVIAVELVGRACFLSFSFNFYRYNMRQYNK